MTLGGAAVGAALGFAIHSTSSIAGVQDPSSLAGLAAVLVLAIEGWAVARKSGKPPLRTGVLTLLAGLLVFGFLEVNFPLIYSVASWALLFMVCAYVIAPSILVRMQTTKNRKAVPIGVLAGAAALSVGMIFGDTQVNKWISHGTGNAIQAKPAAGELSAAGSIAALTRYVSDIFRESPPPSGRSSIRGGIEWTRDWGAYMPTTRTRQTARLGLNESGGPTLSFFEHSIFGNAKSDARSIAQLSQCVASKGAATCSATLSIKGMAKFQSTPSSLDLNLATGAGVFSIYLPGESAFVIQLQGTPSSLHDAPGWLSKAPAPPPPPPDESKKDNRPPTVAMAQDQSSGCRIWKPNLAPSDAVTWSGACVVGLAEGHGTAKWTAAGQNTLTYEGTFRSGLLQGRGKMTAAGGDSYKGEYREGRREGRGVYISSNGDRYEGDFRNNKREGSGMLTRADGTRAKGHFIDGKPVADTEQQAVREPKVSGAGSAEEERKPVASDATAQADYQKAVAIAQSEYQQTVSAAQASYEEKKAALQRVSQRDSSEARTRLSLTQSTAQAALEIARQGTNNPTALAFVQNLYNQSVADAQAKYQYENSLIVAQFYQMAKVAQAELSASTRAAQATLQQRIADAQVAHRDRG